MIIKELNWLREQFEGALIIYGKCSALYDFTTPSNMDVLPNEIHLGHLQQIVSEIYDEIATLKDCFRQRIDYLDHSNDIEKEI